MDAKAKGDLREKAVNEIASKTYLKYWCYPNPKDEKGNRKEVCDLLILFKNTLILFSVKNYAFDGNYSRYFNKTLTKAVSQIQGAERKLLHNDRNVFIKHPDKTELIEIDQNSIKEVQRLIVNLNTKPLFYPGGRLTNKNEYVHILNWDSFLRLVIELDTIPDFIEYLKTRELTFREKELLILTGEESDYDSETGLQLIKHSEPSTKNRRNIVLLSGNELDLLADYYFNDRNFNDHLTSTEYTGMSYEMDGRWLDYLSRKEVIRKKEEDKRSYFVDEFVKREVLYKSDETNLIIASQLLSLSRFERRILGQQFFDFSEKYKDRNDRFIARRYGKFDDCIIGFMLYGSVIKREEALTPLQIAIAGFAHWEGYKTKRILMIGFTNERRGFLYGFNSDVKPLSEQEGKELISNLNLLGWFKNMEQSIFSVEEYPDR